VGAAVRAPREKNEPLLLRATKTNENRAKNGVGAEVGLGVGADAPVPSYFPTGQSKQLVADREGWCCPGLQERQLAPPCTSWYRPAGQGEHAGRTVGLGVGAGVAADLKKLEKVRLK
jgi:hypothetical protein